MNSYPGVRCLLFCSFEVLSCSLKFMSSSYSCKKMSGNPALSIHSRLKESSKAGANGKDAGRGRGIRIAGCKSTCLLDFQLAQMRVCVCVPCAPRYLGRDERLIGVAQCLEWLLRSGPRLLLLSRPKERNRELVAAGNGKPK